MHETLSPGNTRIFLMTRMCVLAKINDRAASVVAPVHAHAHILPDHVTRSIS